MLKSNSFQSRNPGLFILTAVSIGGALEWYEIGLFLSWPLVIQEKTDIFDQTITDSLNLSAVLLMVFFALASGGARGIGGWFFGRKGDKEGRRGAFSLTVLLSSLPSLALPLISFFFSYDEWIKYATITFAIFKFFQGMPAGGEFPGAICYLAETENTVQNQPSWVTRRYMCSYTMLGPQIGLCVSTIVCLVLKYFFSLEFLLNQGWQFVFLSSGIMGVGGFLLRKKLHETASFLDLKIHHKISLHPVRLVFKKYFRELVFGFMISVFEIVLFIVVSLMPIFFSKAPFFLSDNLIIQLSFFSTLLRTVFLPIIGRLSTKYIYFPWLKTSAFGVIAFSILLYFFIVRGNLVASLLIYLIIIFLYSIQAAILPSLLAGLFPTPVRYTGVAFSFNICDGILLTVVTSISYYMILNNMPSFVLILPVSALVYLITAGLRGNGNDCYR